MNSIEPAKSSRASCRTCKKKIKKEKPRLGVETEFTRGEDTYTSMKWHHLDCAMEKIPEEVLTAEIKTEVTSRGKPLKLSEDDIEKIEKFRKKYNKSGLAIKTISEIKKGGNKVNVEASVLRIMKPTERENPNGEMQMVSMAYVEDEEGYRSKIYLWNEHSKISAEKGQRIVIIKGVSELARNDKIQINALNESKVLIDPNDEELEEHSESIDLYVSDAWNRPTGKPVEFTYAPTGRASCGICSKKINKGEVKLVKPEWMENENTGRSFPGERSYHLKCVMKDDHGEEMLHEAVSRVSMSFLEENINEMKSLMNNLPNIEAKTILQKIID